MIRSGLRTPVFCTRSRNECVVLQHTACALARAGLTTAVPVCACSCLADPVTANSRRTLADAHTNAYAWHFGGNFAVLRRPCSARTASLSHRTGSTTWSPSAMPSSKRTCRPRRTTPRPSLPRLATGALQGHAPVARPWLVGVRTPPSCVPCSPLLHRATCRHALLSVPLCASRHLTHQIRGE